MPKQRVLMFSNFIYIYTAKARYLVLFSHLQLTPYRHHIKQSITIRDGNHGPSKNMAGFAKFSSSFAGLSSRFLSGYVRLAVSIF